MLGAATAVLGLFEPEINEPPPRVGDWMQTVTGKAYWPLSPRVEDIDIETIAHALSMLCRFGGHVKRFYSVAEHSILVSQVVPPQYALQGLLHDATEAFVGDVVRPLKQNLAGYADIEARNWEVIAKWAGIPVKLHPSVKMADNTVLLAEKEELLLEPPIPWYWAADLTPAAVTVRGFDPITAKRRFLQRYEEIVGVL